MGTHTELDPNTTSTLERAMNRQIDSMGGFDRSFDVVMGAANRRQRKVTATRRATAVGAMAALIATGVGVSQIRRPAPSVVAAEQAPSLRLVPTYLPGGTDKLYVTRMSSIDVVVGYEAAFTNPAGIILASTTKTSVAGMKVGESLQTAVFTNARYPFTYDSGDGLTGCLRWKDTSQWIVSVCTEDSAQAPQLTKAVAESLKIDTAGKIGSTQLPAGFTTKFVEAASDLQPSDSWSLRNAGGIVISAAKLSGRAEKVGAGVPPYSKTQPVTVRGHEGVANESGVPSISWIEDGWLMRVFGLDFAGVSGVTELQKIAESLKPVSVAEWEKLQVAPGSAERVGDADRAATDEIDTGRAEWKLTMANATTDAGCVNLELSIKGSASTPVCASVNDNQLMWSGVREVGGQQVAIVLVSQDVDSVSVGGSEPEAVATKVVALGKNWKSVGVAVIPVTSATGLTADLFTEEAPAEAPADAPADAAADDASATPIRTKVGSFPIG
jgi:hypothetical protein